MIICSRLERVPDARYKTTLKNTLDKWPKDGGNEFSYNAVAQNLVESGLRHRKVNTGA